MLQSAYRAMHLQACVHMKPIVAIRIKQFKRSASFPVRAVHHRMSVDAICQTEDSGDRCDDTEGGKRQQRISEAVSWKRAVDDRSVDSEVSRVGLSVA